MELPVGRVLGLDRGADGRDHRDYIFKQGGTWFSLRCAAHVPPGDRWLSIAETFEFLPAEE